MSPFKWDSRREYNAMTGVAGQLERHRRRRKIENFTLLPKDTELLPIPARGRDGAPESGQPA